MNKGLLLLLCVCFISGCVTEKKETDVSLVHCGDTLHINDADRYFRIVHDKDDSVLIVAISDSLRNASVTLSDSSLQLKYLFDVYFKGVYSEPQRYAGHNDDDSTTLDPPLQEIRRVIPRYAAVADTNADVRVDNIRLLPGRYFSTTGRCVQATLMEFRTHHFPDRNHPFTPDYMPFAYDETTWSLLQRKEKGAIVFHVFKSITNVVGAPWADSATNETEQCRLVPGYSLRDSVPVVAFEYSVIQKNSIRRELEFYAIGDGAKQVLSIPLEFTIEASKAPGSFKVLTSENDKPGNILTYRQIIENNDTISNTIEEYYWLDTFYSLKERKELVKGKK